MGKYVKYVGTSHNRIIYDHEWRQSGVNDQGTLVWTRANNWCVSVGAISDNAMPYIVADPELIILDALEGAAPDTGGDQVWPEKFNGYLSTFGVPTSVNDDTTETVSVPLGLGTTSATGGEGGGSTGSTGSSPTGSGSSPGTGGSGMSGSSS